jgi:hypothetical protein
VADLTKQRENEIESGNARVSRSNLDDNARQYSLRQLDLENQQRYSAEAPGIRTLATTAVRTTPSTVFDKLDKGGNMQDAAMKRIEEIQHSRRVSFTQAAIIFSNEHPQEAENYRQRVLAQAAATTQTTDSRTAGTGSAVVRFDALVDTKRKANPKLGYADAILLAARENPTLAAERNAEITIRIGPGGVAMTNF